MKIFIGLVLLCITVSTYAAPLFFRPIGVVSQIIGGEDVLNAKYPYQVSLRLKETNMHKCGGSIINKRWILTAAHCFLGISDWERNKSFVVVVGTNKLNGENGQFYNSEYVFGHPDFDLDNPSNDIGVIRVDRDIEFNDRVQPIRLPGEDFTKENYPAVLTGWGSTEVGGASADILQEITLKVISQEQCKREISKPITNSHICTFTKIGEGTCHADSGGPLVADGIQIGIVSFGKPCARGKPDVFTRVFTFLDWIAEQQSKF